jgi:hypothetical protein
MEVWGRKKAVQKVKRREKGGTRDWMSTGPTKPDAWRNNQCVDSSGVAAASLDPHSIGTRAAANAKATILGRRGRGGAGTQGWMEENGQRLRGERQEERERKIKKKIKMV